MISSVGLRSSSKAVELVGCRHSLTAGQSSYPWGIKCTTSKPASTIHALQNDPKSGITSVR